MAGHSEMPVDESGGEPEAFVVKGERRSSVEGSSG